jgi:cob(I)alamin adenosyltransferase
MPRLTRIYTRGGDDGSTGLGTGQRVRKDDRQVAAYGDVDELNAAIGLCRASGLSAAVEETLRRVQSELLNLGGLLCMIDGEQGTEGQAPPLIMERHVRALEAACDKLNEELGPLENFILPAGSEPAARLHIARTICRRAERTVVRFASAVEVPAAALRYLNRLSDLLFIMARYENRARGVGDELWDTRV